MIHISWMHATGQNVTVLHGNMSRYSSLSILTIHLKKCNTISLVLMFLSQHNWLNTYNKSAHQLITSDVDTDALNQHRTLLCKCFHNFYLRSSNFSFSDIFESPISGKKNICPSRIESATSILKDQGRGSTPGPSFSRELFF